MNKKETGQDCDREAIRHGGLGAYLSPSVLVMDRFAVRPHVMFRNVNGEFSVGGYCPIPVPTGEKFPRPRPREGSWGALLPHPHPRSGI